MGSVVAMNVAYSSDIRRFLPNLCFDSPLPSSRAEKGVVWRYVKVIRLGVEMY